MKVPIALVLFDLDGTLIDSAPDLAGAANDLRAQRGLPALPYDRLRPLVGTGARGMVGASFGVSPGEPDFEPLRDEFLAIYQARMLQETRVFDAMVPVLQSLDARSLPWGIVTNKNERFAWPVIDGLELSQRLAVRIAGDTTAHAKPHPEPLLEAARRVGVPPEACVYVGDDLRDVEAGRAAGMRTLAAAWGYLGSGETIDAWQADAILNAPADLLRWLDTA